jgi:HTH-type transcriptional regulator/antitoxin HigA
MRNTTRVGGKVTATASSGIDPRKYGRLLSRALPGVIETEEENEAMLAALERLLEKGKDRMTPEESRLFKLMVWLIEDFERRAYPVPAVAPHQVLRHLMEERDLRQADLLPIFGLRGYISDVVNGKRGISKERAKSLAEFFHVSPDLFF